MNPAAVKTIVYGRLIKKWRGVWSKWNNLDDLAQDSMEALTEYDYDVEKSRAQDPALHWICMLTDHAVHNFNNNIKNNLKEHYHCSYDGIPEPDVAEYYKCLTAILPQNQFADPEHLMMLKEYFEERSLGALTPPDYAALNDVKFPRGPKDSGTSQRKKAVTAMKRKKFDAWVEANNIQPGPKEISDDTLWSCFIRFAKREDYISKNTWCKWMKLLFEFRKEKQYPGGKYCPPTEVIYYKVSKYF